MRDFPLSRQAPQPERTAQPLPANEAPHPFGPARVAALLTPRTNRCSSEAIPRSPKRILVTGGAGFIGSHTCLVLLEAGYSLVVLDNFSNSSPESLRRVVEIVGGDASSGLTVVEGDLRQARDLDRAFGAGGDAGAIEAVVHFAGLKAVAESVANPLHYWDVNVGGSRQLLAAMAAHGCHTLLFSSSSTVYGMPERVPVPETAPLQPINPYGHTKAAVEQMLADVVCSGQPSGASWRIARLRYFNPVGAHPSGRIGEDPLGGSVQPVPVGEPGGGGAPRGSGYLWRRLANARWHR